MSEPEIKVEHRETLAELLSEAAEIEHGLMCCYLYAAWSIGAPAQREQPPERAAAMKRWRSVILDVARDEMSHLANVSNIANAIGIAPHFRRPNFPVSPGYHPAGVLVSLAPFSLGTMDHFVFLERPEGVELPDGEGFIGPFSYLRGSRDGRLIPNAQDYATVGHLYRGIRSGLEHVADKVGEEALFCGSPKLQVGPPSVQLRGLHVVHDLDGARRAIDAILEQGEGTSSLSEDSHYASFVRVRDELRAILAQDPSFDPARGVARNPVMRRPPIPENRAWISAEPAATLLDLGNALYFLMLRGLQMLFSPVACEPGVRPLALELAMQGMMALTPIGELLTEFPADPEALPGVRAGLTFTMSRTLHAHTEARGSLRSASELTRGVAEGMRTHALPLDGSLEPLTHKLTSLAERLSQAAAQATTTRTVSAASPPPPAASAEPYAPGPIEEAVGKELTLRFETKRCIHSRHCVLSAPKVFLANVQGEWIFPDQASVETLLTVAHDCPSGAITYERRDGGEPERAPLVNVLRVRENGPYAVHADTHLEGHGALLRATLCRCGASRNKPFCDGSHHDVPFVATGEPATSPSEPLAQRGGALTLAPQENGPLALTGSVEICSGTGRTITRTETARLCRCGGSSSKPFCDGTHARIGFRAPGV